MADEMNSPPSGGGGGKLKKFIKKNKTLSAVLGIGGLYILFKETKKNTASEEVIAPENTELPTTGPNGITGEDSQEGVDQEINRVSEENQEEKREREQREMERENENKEGSEPNEPGEPAEPKAPEDSTGNGEGPAASPGSDGLSINGKTFAGATKKEIVNTGQSDGGKKWIEYLITFPGRQEHWQYFPATNNWKQVKNSATGPASGKNPTEADKPSGGGGSNGGTSNPPPISDPNHPNAVNTGIKSPDGSLGGHTAPKGYHLYVWNGYIWRAPDATGIGNAQPVSAPKQEKKQPAPTGGGGGGGGSSPAPAPAPPAAPAHPNAVNTGNKCVNGGVGGHTAPAGYHLFCENGWIMRAPNS